MNENSYWQSRLFYLVFSFIVAILLTARASRYTLAYGMEPTSLGLVALATIAWAVWLFLCIRRFAER